LQIVRVVERQIPFPGSLSLTCMTTRFFAAVSAKAIGAPIEMTAKSASAASDVERRNTATGMEKTSGWADEARGPSIMPRKFRG
jgi:hypothetical protein